MPSAPLAGRPPFATDEPDTIYETAPLATRRRVAPPKPENPNNRSSAYDMYDSYLSEGSIKNPFKTPPATPGGPSSSHLRPPVDTSADANRQSGVGGIGMGLLNMDFSDSEDEDDDAPRKKPAPAANGKTNTSPSKNAALLAAIGTVPSSSSAPRPLHTTNTNNSPPKPNTNLTIDSAKANAPPVVARSPPPIAAPRPGYAAPMPSAFGQNPFEGPSPSPASSPASPPGLGPQGPHGLNRLPSTRIPPPKPIGGVPTPVPMPHHMPRVGGAIAVPPAVVARGGGAPIPLSLSPAPLQAPATPIMPVFALPRKGSGDKESSSLTFSTPSTPLPRPPKPIMRSQTEDPLLPRRGEKGDDFWRRFSMIAREDMRAESGAGGGKGKKESLWLRKTRNGSNRLSRWVWVLGVVLLLAIIGAIVLGVVLNKGGGDEPSKEPSILVGGTSKIAGAPTPTPAPGTGAAAAGTTSRSILHVSPTHTIDARGLFERVTPTPTGLSGAVEGFNGSVVGGVKEREVERREVKEREVEREVRRRHRARRL